MDDLTQIQNLLGGSNSVNAGLGGFDINKFMAWLIIPSVVLTIIFCLWVLVNMYHRHKVERAIFEIRDILREMNKSQQQNSTPKPIPAPVSEKIAEVENTMGN